MENCEVLLLYDESCKVTGCKGSSDLLTPDITALASSLVAAVALSMTAAGRVTLMKFLNAEECWFQRNWLHETQC